MESKTVCAHCILNKKGDDVFGIVKFTDNGNGTRI